MKQANNNPTADLAAAHVETVVNNSGSSFLAAMRVLPRGKRDAMFALYSFCREVDDVADEGGTPVEKHGRLAEWRIEIDRLFEGRAVTAIGRALAPHVARFELRKADFLALIDGMEMDSADLVRIADDDALDLYCDRVACAVGRLSNRVFEVAPASLDSLASALGCALQMTNILRDLKEDAGRNRLYVPTSLLHRSGIVDVSDVWAVLAHPEFPAVCEIMVARTLRRYAEAKAALSRCEPRSVRPAVIMMEIYREILRRLVRRGWVDLGRPVHVPKLRKLLIAIRHGVF